MKNIRTKIISTAIIFLICLILFWFFIPIPSLNSHPAGESQVFYSENGELLRLELARDQRYRLFCDLAELPTSLITSTLQYEDQYFYQHLGVNPAALWRAFVSTYITKQRRVGASTLTMQLARMRYRINTQNISGKLLQIFRALQIERHYSKQQILSHYFNYAPYGGNVESVCAASLIYFNKPISRLTWPEAVALSVIPQNPNARNPNKSGNSTLEEARQRLISQLVNAKKLSKDYIDLAPQYRSTKQLPFIAPHYIRALKNRTISQGSLSAEKQRLIKQSVKNYIKERRDKGIENTAVMLVDYRDMQVKAHYGSADFFNNDIFGQVDGTNAKRSPGSTLKPFIYALALEQGLIHPKTSLKDAPKRYGAYTPENYDRQFLGPISAEDALIYSRNVPAVNLLAKLKNNSLLNLLVNAEVTKLKNAEHYGLALALGGVELSMQELIGLYAMLANGGEWRPLSWSNNQPKNTFKRVLSAEASWLTLNALSKHKPPETVVNDYRGLGLQTKHRYPVAWKTGTSWAYRDAWAVGVVGPYVLAVWVGNFNGSSNPAFIGRQAAAPLFFRISNALSYLDSSQTRQQFPANYFAKPKFQASDSLTVIDVCKGTGGLPNKYCPATEKTWFIAGVSPIDVSKVHRPVWIDETSGKRLCKPTETSITQVYEFWPSDIQSLFRQAGLPRRSPPAFKHKCENFLGLLGQQATVPAIKSPDSSVEYTFNLNQTAEQQKIPFHAVADSSIEHLYWFLDKQFIAKTKTGQKHYWPPVVGEHNLTVYDDHGNADSVALYVKPLVLE